MQNEKTKKNNQNRSPPTTAMVVVPSEPVQRWSRAFGHPSATLGVTFVVAETHFLLHHGAIMNLAVKKDSLFYKFLKFSAFRARMPHNLCTMFWTSIWGILKLLVIAILTACALGVQWFIIIAFLMSTGIVVDPTWFADSNAIGRAFGWILLGLEVGTIFNILSDKFNWGSKVRAKFEKWGLVSEYDVYGRARSLSQRYAYNWDKDQTFAEFLLIRPDFVAKGITGYSYSTSWPTMGDDEKDSADLTNKGGSVLIEAYRAWADWREFRANQARLEYLLANGGPIVRFRARKAMKELLSDEEVVKETGIRITEKIISFQNFLGHVYDGFKEKTCVMVDYK